MVIFINFFRRLARRAARSDLIVIAILAGLLIMTGTVAYSRLEGWSLADSLYATVITVTTVGYGDFSPQTPAGRTFAIFFTFFAIGIAGYAISTFAATVVEGRAAKKAKFLRKRRMKRIEALQDHYILCCDDIIGMRIAETFYQSGAPFIIVGPDEYQLRKTLLFSHPEYLQQKLQTMTDIVEVDLSHFEDRSLAELGELLGTPYILDDPTDDTALVRAGLARAAGLMAALPDERDNLAIVVGARALANRFGNNKLRIMARVDDATFMRKLHLSGADYVRVPAISSGMEMATHMMHPEIGSWWYSPAGLGKQKTSRLAPVNLAQQPDWVGQTVGGLHQQEGVQVVAIKRDGDYVSPPPADMQLQADDILITLSPKTAA